MGTQTILPTGLLTAIETVSSRAIPFPRIGARSAAARHMASENRLCLKSQPAKRWDTPPVGGQQGANEHGDSTRPPGTIAFLKLFSKYSSPSGAIRDALITDHNSRGVMATALWTQVDPTASPETVTDQYIECTNPARFRKTQRPFLADDCKWNLLRRPP